MLKEITKRKRKKEEEDLLIVFIKDCMIRRLPHFWPGIGYSSDIHLQSSWKSELKPTSSLLHTDLSFSFFSSYQPVTSDALFVVCVCVCVCVCGGHGVGKGAVCVIKWDYLYVFVSAPGSCGMWHHEQSVIIIIIKFWKYKTKADKWFISLSHFFIVFRHLTVV